MIGLGIVALFMILYYRVPGLISVIALLIYTAIVFAIFKLVPVTLTLAGIAGFILSIGMAVDANVLIFARIKEELHQGGAAGAGGRVRIRPCLAVDPRFEHHDHDHHVHPLSVRQLHRHVDHHRVRA